MRRLLRKLRVALRSPGYALRSVARDLVRADERTLARWTGRTAREVRRWAREPLEDEAFRIHLERCERRLVEAFGDVPGGKPTAKGVRLQYALVRAARPELIVETGVASGVSTTHFLHALAKNGRGRLVSVDLPGGEFLPEGEEPGWMVPDGLRGAWDLRLGDARELLPGVLEEEGPVDVFVHDSLHTLEHMLFELREAYPAVAPGGFVVCDDADLNEAFATFADETGEEEAALLRGVGFLRKAGPR